MSQGRAPWRTFARDAAAVLEGKLAELGFARDPAATDVGFLVAGHRVALSYDPYDVALDVRVDGLWLERLLASAGIEATVPREPGRHSLARIGDALALLIPALDGATGKAALRREEELQATLTGDSAVAIARVLASDPDAAARISAAQRLAWMSPVTQAAGDALGHALTDEALEVRRAAAEALALHGAEGPRSTIPALRRALTDEDEELRKGAERALAQLGDLPLRPARPPKRRRSRR